MGNVIWACTVFVPLMTLVLGLLRPMRRAVENVARTHGLTAAEHDASAAERLAEAEDRRAGVAVRRGALEAETERERAKLGAEAEQFRIEAEAARLTLDDAVAARRVALAARGQAEADLAPELVRQAAAGRPGSNNWLAHAYTAYCENVPSSYSPKSIGEWVMDDDGQVPAALVGLLS